MPVVYVCMVHVFSVSVPVTSSYNILSSRCELKCKYLCSQLCVAVIFEFLCLLLVLLESFMYLDAQVCASVHVCASVCLQWLKSRFQLSALHYSDGGSMCTMFFSDAGDVPYYHLRCLIATLQLLIWAVNIVCFVIMLCNTKELFSKAKTSMWNAMQIHEIRLQMLLSCYMCILESSFCPSHFLHVYALLV